MNLEEKLKDWQDLLKRLACNVTWIKMDHEKYQLNLDGTVVVVDNYETLLENIKNTLLPTSNNIYEYFEKVNNALECFMSFPKKYQDMFREICPNPESLIKTFFQFKLKKLSCLNLKAPYWNLEILELKMQEAIEKKKASRNLDFNNCNSKSELERLINLLKEKYAQNPSLISQEYPNVPFFLSMYNQEKDYLKDNGIKKIYNYDSLFQYLLKIHTLHLEKKIYNLSESCTTAYQRLKFEQKRLAILKTRDYYLEKKNYFNYLKEEEQKEVSRIYELETEIAFNTKCEKRIAKKLKRIDKSWFTKILFRKNKKELQKEYDYYANKKRRYQDNLTVYQQLFKETKQEKRLVERKISKSCGFDIKLDEWQQTLNNQRYVDINSLEEDIANLQKEYKEKQQNLFALDEYLKSLLPLISEKSKQKRMKRSSYGN